MLNKIVIMGRCGSDPELRKTPNGLDVSTVNLAVDRDFKDKGTGKTVTDWIPVVAWKNTAVFLAKYFTKGRMAVVEGRLQMRDWTDKEGNKRRSAEVVADSVYFGDSKRDDAPSYNAPAYGGTAVSSGAPQPVDTHADFAEIGEEDGELPF